MAESYRPLSRHNVNIAGNTSPIIHTVHSMDTSVHKDYGEVNVYETTVRPKSRRAEGINRPKSGYNNRFQRERTRTRVSAESDAPVERPTTSRGYRNGSEPRQHSPSRDGSLTPRPKSSYGARRRSLIELTSQDDVRDAIERPKSRRGMRSSYESRTPPPPAAMLQRERTLYDGEMTLSDRPRTRQGRAKSQSVDYSGSQPSTPRNTSDPLERPKTGRGRRRTDSHGEDYSGPMVDDVMTDPVERPLTSRGRRKSLAEYSRVGSPQMERPQTGRRRSLNYPDPSPYYGPGAAGGPRVGAAGGEADILILEDDQPATTSMKRRSHHPIDLSYMSPRHPGMGNSPSPTPRPPTGRRSKSSRKKRTAEPPLTPPYTEYERQLTAASIASSRPASSTFNRFQPLPAIGTNTTPSRLIHIPHAGNPGGPHQGQGQLNLSEQTQRLHLEDSTGNKKAMEEEEEEDGPVYPTLDRNIVLPPEPVGPGDDRMILAIKLPDGTRVQRGFYTRDTLRDVRSFAEVEAQLDFSNCELVCDVPRKVYRDLSINISESGLHNRTVLHVQLPDDEL